ncbi:hypothetical protein GCM10007100_32710 [Roseibacillus persicicus]|uniref:Uncharacterized protein n=1 Tax=Roseibacillus persicicus TaxID=454148 RepID=A0A918TYP6_9BACT|nr:hypothetical protein GCM10007100_32710 [Roseibacillus persicicus]
MPGGYTLPFVISGLSDSQYTNITTVDSGPYIVRQAQETVAANGRQTAFVNTDGLSTYSNGALHFEASAQIAIGEASAAQMLALESKASQPQSILTQRANRNRVLQKFHPPTDYRLGRSHPSLCHGCHNSLETRKVRHLKLV